MEVGKTPSSPAPVFPHAPKPLQGIAVGATASRQEMQPKPRLPVGQRRRPLVCTVDATPVDDHHHLFPALAQERPDVMDILPQPFGIKLGDHLIEDCRGAILARAQDAEQHAIRHPAPTPIAAPCLAFEGLFTSDVAGAEGPCRHTKALRFAAPPARPRQGKPPQDRFICVEQNTLTTLGAVLQGGQCERPPRQFSGGGSQPTCGPAVADVFFLTPRARSHGSAGPRSGGRVCGRVPDNATGNGSNRARAGLGRHGDCDGAPRPPALSVVGRSGGDLPNSGPRDGQSDGPICAAPHR